MPRIAFIIRDDERNPDPRRQFRDDEKRGGRGVISIREHDLKDVPW
jgi:hypothetical protein